ncbi:hypothetical protein [Methylocystis heyeri]|uniref:Baseplate assembly protein n=1 Tax=Methylocystis heyeri TaxID=391905 RepID=A0A6B8KGJ0_9HYPH|nr:hypothetical protein [Methylocystis heyeri]QGM46739.1 hypothetical protein H2LOC_014130 [Methylocystis heyeri]
MRVGLDANTGAVLTGWAECQQSIGLIARTAIGSLALGRSFGSDAPALQDAPQNALTIMDHFMAIAEALRKWEPGYRLKNIQAKQLGADGRVGFALTGDFYPNALQGDYSVVETNAGLQVVVGGFAQ